MAEENVIAFVSKQVERLNSFEKLIGLLSSDFKDMKYKVTQYDAKIQNFERQILAKKTEMADLDEQIRRKKIEVAGSFNNLRDDLQKRELALTKALAELKVQQDNTKARALVAENLINKAEKVIGRTGLEPMPAPAPVAAAHEPHPVVSTEPEKRSPGRPRKEASRSF